MDECLDIRNCSCDKRLIGELVLECENKILNSTKTSIDEKKETCKKNNCLIDTISLVVI